MKVDVTISILVKKRRNDKVLEMFYIDLVQFQASYLIDHIDHVLQLLLWRGPSKAGHHLVEIIDKNLIAPKRLFWGGSSSWHGGQLQKKDFVWDIKEKIQNTKILRETQRPSDWKIQNTIILHEIQNLSKLLSSYWSSSIPGDRVASDLVQFDQFYKVNGILEIEY